MRRCISRPQLLAVSSVGFFWLMPFSPWLSILAIQDTRGTTGWSRRLAVAGAILCITYTVAAAIWISLLAWSLRGS